MPTFVYMTRCDGCGHCVDICPSDIMHIDKTYRRAYNIEPSMCWEFYSCVKACPQNAIDVSVGRLRYNLGHGFLLYDGAAEGGSRGGYWTNARQAFELAAIARIAPGRHAVETFYLDKDELEEYDAELELRLKREYADVFPLFHFCVLTQEATYLCNRFERDFMPQASYPFFHITMEDVWVWDKNRPTRIIPKVEIYTTQDVTVEILRAPDAAEAGDAE